MAPLDLGWIRRDPPFAQIIACAMLGWALLPINPYSYYILLRVVVCGVLIHLAVRALSLEKMGWVWTLGITAFLYNPVLRIHLDKGLWSIINALTIALLAVTVWALRPAGTE